ncbi:MAG TPA: PDZ domain-containing protein [Blastocatellia bacterium]|nr:PDZ domain-containing protein [Blastocatellia bacterium]
MKRMLVSCLAVLLASGSVAVASPNSDCEQQTPERPRRVQLTPRSFLGVELSEVNKETVSRLKLREERGAVIDGVTSGSGAAQAGLQKNDVIIKWDGQRIESAREVSRQIHETPPGRSVRLGVMRDGKEIEVNVTMGERPSPVTRVTVPRPAVASLRVRPERVRPEIVVGRGRARALGVELQSMTPQLAEYFGLSKRSGALVIFVFADSPAAKAGLKAGDVILSVGAETVQNPVDVRRALSDKPEGSQVEFKIIRDKQEKTLNVPMEKGGNSWLFTDADDGAFRYALAPLTIQAPKFKLASGALKVPSVNWKPMKIQIPKWHLEPLTIPRVNLEDMDLNIPEINLEPMDIQIPEVDLKPMDIQIPNIKLEPMEIQIPEINLQPMRLQIPHINLSPLNIVVAPRRVVL